MSTGKGFVSTINYEALQEEMRRVLRKNQDMGYRIQELEVDVQAGAAIVECILAMEERVDELELAFEQIASMVTDDSGHNMQKVGAIARKVLIHTKNTDENS